MSLLRVAGVDEAGRGPLAGPVVAAAVVLPPGFTVPVADSKKLSEKAREALYDEIIAHADCFALGYASAAEIDALNILKASLLAMRRALEHPAMGVDEGLIDGNRVPVTRIPCRAIVGGDASEPAISAASILAKVARDRMTLALDRRYPAYGFARHKGYPTKLHLEALAQHGPAPCHRRTFGPVRRIIEARG